MGQIRTYLYYGGTLIAGVSVLGFYSWYRSHQDRQEVIRLTRDLVNANTNHTQILQQVMQIVNNQNGVINELRARVEALERGEALPPARALQPAPQRQQPAEVNDDNIQEVLEDNRRALEDLQREIDDLERDE